MALTHLHISFASPAHPKRKVTREFLIDSGATYSVIPRKDLEKLGIRPHSKRSFILANGEHVEREIGGALFEYQGYKGEAPVIFGEKGDSVLLGAVTLESLGLILDPLRRELKALPMIM